MISTAWAQTAAAAPANDMAAIVTSALPLVLVFVIFYFFVMRPPMVAAKKHTEMLGQLKKGDVIVTDGGLVGEIQNILTHMIHLNVGGGQVVTVAREAVRSTLTADAAKGWEAKSKK